MIISTMIRSWGSNFIARGVRKKGQHFGGREHKKKSSKHCGTRVKQEGGYIFVLWDPRIGEGEKGRIRPPRDGKSPTETCSGGRAGERGRLEKRKVVH